MKKTIAQETEKRVLDLYQNSKLSAIQIAKECRISACTVYRLARVHNIKRYMEDGDYTPENIDASVKLYEQGERVRDILEQTGVSYARFYQEIRDRGIQKRKIEHSKHIPEKIDRQKVYELYQKNNSIDEIAKKLEHSISKINEIIAEGLKNGEIKLSDAYLKKKQENETCDRLAKIIGSQENPEFTVIKASHMYKVNKQKLYYRVRKFRKESECCK